MLHMTRLGALPITTLLLLNLAVSLALIAPVLTDAQAFQAFLAHPQAWGGLKLTLATSIISTALSLGLAVLIVMGSHKNLTAETGFYLAVPHLALAIGLGFLIAPTGLIARLIGTALGWTTPPQWVTVQDPYGAALTAALVLKETPFLVWALASLLNRDDLKQLFAGHMKVARSLGHSGNSAWIAVLLPQLLPRIIWPIIAVFVYGATVVDMAIVIGPTQPPVLANIIWTDLNDGEPLNNARGGAGVILLSSMIMSLLLVVGLFLRLGMPLRRFLFLGYPGTRKSKNPLSGQIWGFWRGVYSLIFIFILVASISGLYSYPGLLPDAFASKGWSTLIANPRPLVTSFALALSTAAAAIAASIAWLESQPEKRDTVILMTCGAALCMPALMIALGQYRLFLQLGITGTALAMFLAHVLPVTAYIFVMLQGPYRAYDPRWQAAAQGLLSSRMSFLVKIKWPMLKAPILSAAAVGFAVSIAQYVPAQLASAGRFTTLPMEAVTLSSGGNRTLIATYAVALTVLPLAAFLLASFFGRPRWSET